MSRDNKCFWSCLLEDGAVGALPSRLGDRFVRLFLRSEDEEV